MDTIKRRQFIKKGTIALGGLGIAANAVSANSSQAPPDPDPPFLGESVNLWEDDSSNNGSNPNYRPEIKIYYPTARGRSSQSKNLAAVLICPGGGYSIQADHEGQPFAQLFAMNGIVGVVLTYRVSPDRYPGSYSDACRAIRLLRKNSSKYNIDPEKIGIMGFSAGGHLASTVATQPDLYNEPEDDLVNKFTARPNRLILGYPVISFIDSFAHTGSAKNLLGEDAGDDMKKQLSNNYQVTENNPPAFLFHTADDKGVPVDNSLRFADACLKNGVSVELHVYPKGNHGVGMALDNPSLRTWSELLMNWLDTWKS